jgi:osmotically-inducible protein OsmY
MDTSLVDDELRARIERELATDPNVPCTSIGVSVTDHIVTLSGTVHSMPERLAAVEATRRVPGVHAISDRISMKPPTSLVFDNEISYGVEQALENSRLGGVTATVRGKTVVLSGEVLCQAERRTAQQVVESVDGVGYVVNEISVKTRPSEASVRSRIASAFHYIADVDAQTIHVTTRGNEVWLGGSVHSLAARTCAESAAWTTPGVEEVHNDLIVGPAV